jgi:hypothetical protein
VTSCVVVSSSVCTCVFHKCLSPLLFFFFVQWESAVDPLLLRSPLLSFVGLCDYLCGFHRAVCQVFLFLFFLSLVFPWVALSHFFLSFFISVSSDALVQANTLRAPCTHLSLSLVSGNGCDSAGNAGQDGQHRHWVEPSCFLVERHMSFFFCFSVLSLPYESRAVVAKAMRHATAARQ